MTMASEFFCSSYSSETNEGQLESQRHIKTVPEDILDEILVWAWLRSDWKRSRWQFYNRMKKVSRAFRRIIRSVVLRFRCLETGIDFQAYHRMEQARSSDYSYPYLRIRCDDLFSAHLIASALHSFLEHCQSLEIVFSPLISVTRHLSRMTSLLQLNHIVGSIALSFELLRTTTRNEPSSLPTTFRLPSVKRLRIMCTDTTGLVSLNETFWHCIVGPFPNVTDLFTNVAIDHVSWSSDLQYLRTITLQLPAFSTSTSYALDAWRIDDGVRKGTWRYLKTIAVECDQRKPSGWEDLEETCEKHGVEIIQLARSRVRTSSDHAMCVGTVGRHITLLIQMTQMLTYGIIIPTRRTDETEHTWS